MLKLLVLAVSLGALGACASGAGSKVKWSAASWNGIAPKTIGTDNFEFFAAPLYGQGFKLKLTLVTDGSFRVQDSADTLPAELEEAARAATPEGCTYRGLTRTPDGGAEADYTCT